MITVLGTEAEMPPDARVWGRANRALPAAEREGLCWLTLCRLLGWDVSVEYGCEVGAEARCAILARDPASVGTEDAAALRARLDREPLLLVTRAAPPGSPLAELSGVEAAGEHRLQGPLRWRGPGAEREWTAWPELIVTTPDTTVKGRGPSLGPGGGVGDSWAFVGSSVLVSAREVGRGVVATLAAHPVELIDAAPSGSGLLKHLLTRGIPGSPEWLELEGWLIPRMDDPGSSSSVHLDGWAHRSLGEEEWQAVSADLVAREARITVGYVPGWLDDGDAGRGELRVGGERVERVPGRVHPSPLVEYRPKSGDAIQDQPATARGLGALRAAGAGEIELHGFTHVRPEYAREDDPYAAWAAAPDRHGDIGWYRELENLPPPPAGESGPLERGLELLSKHLDITPTVLCCPGHACSLHAANSAAAAGLELIAAESVALRDGERLLWCDHIRNPYLDGASGPWLESGLPVVGCLHDRDLVLNGAAWLGERLDEWSERGATRITDLRELASVLS